MSLELDDVLAQAAADLQSMIKDGFVEEDEDAIYKAFGGKKGEGRVSVPKNITDKQILAYFDFIGRPVSTKKEINEVLTGVRSRMGTSNTTTSKTASNPVANETRLTTEQKKSLTLRQLFEFEAASKPDGSVPDEVKRHVALLEGINDKVTGRPVLDMVVGEMDVGQVFGDVISEGKFRDADVKASPTLRSRSSLLITRLNTMFDNAGFGSGYVKKQVENSLGKEAFNRESGWDYKRSRKVPVGFQSDVYQKLKSILGDDNLPKEVRNQMAAHLFGGFRPENIANFKIENYDKEKGILTFYDKKSKKNKFLVVNPAVQGVLNEQIADRTAGFIFPDARKNQTTLNAVLKNTMNQVSFAKPDGSIKAENFTVYKLRNLNETILTDSGLNESDIDFLNGRKPQSEAAGYVAMAARQRRIKNAANELVASIAGYSGTQTVAQFSADVGISFPEDVLRTKIDRSLLVADEYVAALPDDFLAALEPESGKYSVESMPSADPDQVEQFKNESIAASRLREETALKESAETKKSRLELEVEIQDLDEKVLSDKARREESKKKAKAAAGKSFFDSVIQTYGPSKTTLKTIAALPVVGAPVAGILGAGEARARGADMPEALLAGAGEALLPITPSDIRAGEEAAGYVGSQMQELMEQPSEANPQGLSIMDQMRSMLGQGGGFNFN